MREPTPRTSRLAIAGALAALIAAGTAGFLAGRDRAPPPPAPAATAAPAPPAPRETRAARTLGRFELAALAADAADALASGEPPSPPPSPSPAQSVGQRVDVTLPFGCAGPVTATDQATGWRYDAAAGALRVRVRPVAWTAADWGLDADADAGAAAIGGFWLARPWSSADRCPVTGAGPESDAQPVTLPGQTVALGFFAGRDARAPAEPRAFETVRRTDAAAVPGPAGLRLRVLGRLGETPGGGPVRCVQPGGIEQRPVCIVAIRPETLRLEDAASGTTLGEWSLAAD